MCVWGGESEKKGYKTQKLWRNRKMSEARGTEVGRVNGKEMDGEGWDEY